MVASRIYRENAEALIRAAARTADEGRRREFLSLAAHWHTLAVKAEAEGEASQGAETEGA